MAPPQRALVRLFVREGDERVCKWSCEGIMPQQLRPGRLSRLLLLAHGGLVLLTLGLAGLMTYVTAEAQATWVRLVVILSVAVFLGMRVAYCTRWLTRPID